MNSGEPTLHAFHDDKQAFNLVVGVLIDVENTHNMHVLSSSIVQSYLAARLWNITQHLKSKSTQPFNQ